MAATDYNAFNLDGIGFGEPRSNSMVPPPQQKRKREAERAAQAAKITGGKGKARRDNVGPLPLAKQQKAAAAAFKGHLANEAQGPAAKPSSQESCAGVKDMCAVCENDDDIVVSVDIQRAAGRGGGGSLRN